MKRTFTAVLAVLLGAVMIASCAKKEPQWKAFIRDYEKVVSRYVAEIEEVKAGTRRTISPELDEQLAEYNKKYDQIDRTLTDSAEKKEFQDAFGDVSFKLIDAYSSSGVQLGQPGTGGTNAAASAD